MKEFDTMKDAVNFCYSHKNGTGAIYYNAKTKKYYVRIAKDNK